MKIPDQADAAYLRRILFVLIVSATATGGIATYTAVNIKQAGQVNFALPILHGKSTHVNQDTPVMKQSRDAGFDNYRTKLISAKLRDQLTGVLDV